VNRRLLLALASTLVAAFGLVSSAGSTNGTNTTTCPGTYKEVTWSDLSVRGDRAKVVFDVATGCRNVELTLVSYKAPGPTFDVNTADQQRVHEFKTQLFSEGKGHTLEVSIPNCYFQVDFVYGKHIEKFGPPDSNNFYYRQGRSIRSAHAGSAPCAESSPPPNVTPASPPPSNTPPPVVVQQAPPVPAPGVELVKTQRVETTGSFVRSTVKSTAGKRIHYRLTATNTSAAPVTITVVDRGCDAGTLAPAGGQLVAAGASVVFTCSHRITKKDGTQVVNVAVATATASNGAQATDTSRVVAQVQAGAVLGAQKTVAKKAVKAKPKPVTKKAQPAKPVVAGASFTG
jgi:hypothetical protein